MKKILILTANSGHGHTSLAYALKEAIDDNIKEKVEIKMFNPLPDFYGGLYSKLNSDWKMLWGVIWHTTNNQHSAKILNTITTSLLKHRFIKELTSFQPDIVISPVELVLPDIRKLKGTNYRQPKVAIYIADPFTPHVSWFINPLTNFFLSPTDETTLLCKTNGIDMNRVKQVGWLTRKEFLNQSDNMKNIRERLQLNPDRFTIFMGGSGNGGGGLPEILRLIVKDGSILNKTQIIINSGRNPGLIKKIKPVCDRNKSNLILLPFTDDMVSYIAASDVVVGKAGPNLLFECIHLNKPFIATGHLPGQEEGNEKFIIDKGIGWVSKNNTEVIEILQTLIEDPSLSISIINNMKTISDLNRNADKRIAEEIYHLF